MPPSDQFYTVRQMRLDLQRAIDFCSTQLSRTLNQEETIYYQARRSAMIEALQISKQLRDFDTIPERNS